MNSSRGQEDFGRLRRLLTLKRHELPPPGYFTRFPQRVTARLAATVPSAPWWERWIRIVDLKPALSGALAVVALGFYALSFGRAPDLDLSVERDVQVLTGAVPHTFLPSITSLAAPLPQLSADPLRQRTNLDLTGPAAAVPLGASDLRRELLWFSPVGFE